MASADLQWAATMTVVDWQEAADVQGADNITAGWEQAEAWLLNMGLLPWLHLICSWLRLWGMLLVYKWLWLETWWQFACSTPGLLMLRLQWWLRHSGLLVAFCGLIVRLQTILFFSPECEIGAIFAALSGGVVIYWMDWGSFCFCAFDFPAFCLAGIQKTWSNSGESISLWSQQYFCVGLKLKTPFFPFTVRPKVSVRLLDPFRVRCTASWKYPSFISLLWRKKCWWFEANFTDKSTDIDWYCSFSALMCPIASVGLDLGGISATVISLDICFLRSTISLHCVVVTICLLKH